MRILLRPCFGVKIPQIGDTAACEFTQELIEKPNCDKNAIRIDEPTIIGRSDHEVVGIRIGHLGVSRRHALIGPTIDGKLSVTNISESNILKADGTPVTKSTLDNGQTLHIWEFPFTVDILSDEKAEVCDAVTMCEK